MPLTVDPVLVTIRKQWSGRGQQLPRCVEKGDGAMNKLSGNKNH
jgi:hypothetical protein